MDTMTQATTQEPVKLTDEQISKIKETGDFEGLTLDQVNDFLARIDASPSIVTPTDTTGASDSKDNGEKANQQPATQNESKAPETSEEEEGEEDHLLKIPETLVDPVTARKYVAKSEEANKYKQKYESELRKREQVEDKLKAINEARDKIKAMPKLSSEEVLSEEGLKTLLKRQNELEELQKASLDKEESFLKKQAQESHINETYLRLYELQNEEPSLSTSVPLRKLNDKYREFENTLRSIAGDGAPERYRKDLVFRKEIDGKGYNHGLSESDFKAYDRILDVHQTAIQNKWDYEYAYFKLSKEKGWDKQVQPIPSAPARVSHALPSTQKDETPILSPHQSSTTPDDFMSTPDKAFAWLEANQSNTSPEARKRIDAIIAKYSG